ncbi:MAG: hypothetical protein WC389_17105 [Lutibacter sp.]|jgi:hypothetical protein
MLTDALIGKTLAHKEKENLGIIEQHELKPDESVLLQLTNFKAPLIFTKTDVETMLKGNPTGDGFFLKP